MIVKKHSLQQMVGVVSRYWGHARQGIGIDMGSHMTKAVALRADGHGFSLLDFSSQPVSEKSLGDHEAYARLLHPIHDKMSVPQNSVGISLSEPAVYVKSLSLPFMREDDLREHLALELDRYIALDVQDVLWDVCYRKSPSVVAEEQQEYFLVVAKKTYVENHVELFHQCGMTVPFVDVDVFALTNMVTYNYGSDGIWVLVHLGPTGILMVVISEGRPVVVRKESYRAEWYGDLLDRVFLYQTKMDHREEPGTSEVLLLGQYYQEVCDQIHETFEGFSDISTTLQDGGVLLSGGYAGAPDMAQKLTSALGIPVNIVDPFQKISVSHEIQANPAFQQMAPMLGVALGVALRGVETYD